MLCDLPDIDFAEKNKRADSKEWVFILWSSYDQGENIVVVSTLKMWGYEQQHTISKKMCEWGCYNINLH